MTSSVTAGAANAFADFLDESMALLSSKKTEIDQVRVRATKNQNTYLTWDHMDIYFATSRGKRGSIRIFTISSND